MNVTTKNAFLNSDFFFKCVDLLTITCHVLKDLLFKYKYKSFSQANL